MAFTQTIDTGTTANDGKGAGLRTNLRILIANDVDLNERVNQLDATLEDVSDSLSKISFANVAAATAEWNAASPKPKDGHQINIEDVDQTYKWASGETSKVLFVKNNLSEAEVEAADADLQNNIDAEEAARIAADAALQVNIDTAQTTADTAKVLAILAI
jgi:hypothetical protein